MSEIIWSLDGGDDDNKFTVWRWALTIFASKTPNNTA